MTSRRLAVLAIGGNALIRDHAHESIPDQYRMVCDFAFDIADMIDAGWNVVVTHGNGPQIAAVIDFLENGGRMGLITDQPNIARALRGETGTRIVAE